MKVSCVSKTKKVEQYILFSNGERIKIGSEKGCFLKMEQKKEILLENPCNRRPHVI